MTNVNVYDCVCIVATHVKSPPTDKVSALIKMSAENVAMDNKIMTQNTHAPITTTILARKGGENFSQH